MIDRDQPYAFLVHPKYPMAFNKAVFKEYTVVNQIGVGIRNIWTFTGIEPISAQKDLIINSNETINATNPLYIGGAVDSWVTDLIWDRVMRIGPDGMPQPWAAESVAWADDTTIDIKLRAGMKWHDGKPVTIDDVIFSFTAPAGDKAPMYKPFVTEIASMEKTGDMGLRMKLKGPNATFFTATLSKINLIPKHVWEPVLKDLEGKPENAEQIKDVNRTGSGPFKIVRWQPNEEILLEAFPDHFKAPKVARWIMRIVPNAEATLGMLKRGELNFLGFFGGDPEVLVKFAKENPDIVVDDRDRCRLRVRRLQQPPPAVRRRRPSAARCRSAIDRRLMVSAAWQDFAVPANSHVSPVLSYWHDPVGRQHEDRPRRVEEDPAGRGLSTGRRQALLPGRQAGKADDGMMMVATCAIEPPLPRLRGRCRRNRRRRGTATEMVRHAPSVADYRDTSPEDGGGE